MAVVAVAVAACGDGGGGGATGQAGGGGNAGGSPDAAAGASGGGQAGTTSDASAGTDGARDAGPDMDPLAALLTAGELAAVKQLSPLPALPPDPTNKYADDAKAAALGQRWFFDPAFSGPLAVADDGTNGGLGAANDTGKIACASCHLGPALDDRRSNPGNVSLGADFLGRNALPMVNASFYKWTNWAGRFSAQWELPIAVVENAKNMNGNRLRVAHRLFDKYRADYEAVFGTLDAAIGSDAGRFPPQGRPGTMAGCQAGDTAEPFGDAFDCMQAADRDAVNRILANFGKAHAAYNRKLVSRDSAFDRFVAGEASALDAAAVRGLKVFLGKGQCVGCHAGPHLSDGAFHNLGVPQIGPRVPATDNGRFADIPPLIGSTFNTAGAFSDDKTTGRLDGLSATPPDETKGQFRTPSLRNVAVTAPYMHAGQFQTLEQVIEFYDRGGAVPAAGTKDAAIVPLGLSAAEKAELAAFLRSLTMAPVAPGLLEDTSAK